MNKSSGAGQPVEVRSTEGLGLNLSLAEARQRASRHKPMLYPAWAFETLSLA
jgi:hypothetical protein